MAKPQNAIVPSALKIFLSGTNRLSGRRFAENSAGDGDKPWGYGLWNKFKANG